jgi:hypothetical protein
MRPHFNQFGLKYEVTIAPSEWVKWIRNQAEGADILPTRQSNEFTAGAIVKVNPPISGETVGGTKEEFSGKC